MTRLLCDEDLDGTLYDALRQQCPDWELIRVQDVGLGGADRAGDPAILEWAAANGLVVMTQDRNTMTAHAHARLAVNLTVPGLIVVKARTPIAQTTGDIRFLMDYGPEGWDHPIVFVPFR